MNELSTTLLLIVKNNKILLAKKKRGFGAGKYNGVGGKVKKNESIKNALIRETQEEIGVTPTSFKQIAQITFDEFVNGNKEKVIMNVFISHDYIGTIIETDEMKPEWFDINNIPYQKMFKDHKYWLNEVLKGNKIKAYFSYDEQFNIVCSNIQKVLNFKT